jgi:hypothetical protein
MWKFLYDNYGCRPVIAIRYFIPNSEEILTNLRKDLTSNFNKQNDLEIYQDSIISEKTLKNLNNDNDHGLS